MSASLHITNETPLVTHLIRCRHPPRARSSSHPPETCRTAHRNSQRQTLEYCRPRSSICTSTPYLTDICSESPFNITMLLKSQLSLSIWCPVYDYLLPPHPWTFPTRLRSTSPSRLRTAVRWARYQNCQISQASYPVDARNIGMQPSRLQ